ncbi:MAG: hypothetical protein SGARI_005902, partial [Bacillariaceae sp.]
MSTSRRKRNKPHVDYCEYSSDSEPSIASEAADALEEDEEADIAKAIAASLEDQTNEPEAKRPRLEELPAFESLPTKAIQQVLRFAASSPAVIFTLATHFKAFHQAISTEIVVETAFLSGKKSRRIITSI